jgi:hypothetical protein
MSSTRSRAERAASDAEGDPVIRPESRGGLTEPAYYNAPLRNRIEQREEPAETHPSNAAADFYYAKYKADQAADQQRERDEQRRNQELIAKNAQQSKDRLKEKLLQIAYADMGATDAERQSIDALVRQNHPERFGDPDTHKFTLMKLRDALSGKD